jgi:hypothetical protein
VAHDIWKQIAATALNELIKAVGEVYAPAFGMTLLQFPNKLRPFMDAIAELQALI